MNGQAIVNAIVAQGGFDTTDGVSRADVTGWAAAAYTDLVVRAGWRVAVKALGPTVAGQAEYALPDTVTDLAAVRVDGRRYDRVGTEQLWDLQSGDLVLDRRANGAFAPSFDDQGVSKVALFPAPTSAGLAVDGLTPEPPADFADDPVFLPITPTDFDWWLIERAVTLGKRLEDEVDTDPGDGLWESRVEKLRRRKNSRVGSGPGQLTVSRRPR